MSYPMALPNAESKAKAHQDYAMGIDHLAKEQTILGYAYWVIIG